MSGNVEPGRAGDFAGSRKGGITLHEIEFAETKLRAGVPLSAVARMIGRPIGDLSGVGVKSVQPKRPAPRLAPRLVGLAPMPSRERLPETYLSLWRGSIPRPDARPTLAAIAKEVATYYGVTVEDLKGPSRQRIYTVPRQAAFWVACEAKRWSLPKIGQFFGDRDHTTVLAGKRRHAERLAEAEAAEARDAA
jgi:hypothetical protein